MLTAIALIPSLPMPLNITSGKHDLPKMTHIGTTLGAGYDLLAGNPNYNGYDPGVMNGGRIIRLVYYGNKPSADGKWAVPDCCYLAPKTACSVSAFTSDTSSIQEYQSALSQNTDVSVGAKGLFYSARFSLSEAYQHAKSDYDAKSSHVELTQAKCLAYEASVEGNLATGMMDLDPTFREAVSALPPTFTLDDYQSFVQSYGSHVISSVIMGGKWTRSVSISSEAYQSLESEHIDVATEAQASFLFASGGASSETDKQTAERKQFEQSTASCLNSAQGGKGMPPGVPFKCFQPSTATGDWSAWEDQVNGANGDYTGPYPVDGVKLVAISKLMNIKNFAPGDPHILQKAAALEQALLCYLAGWDTSHEDCQAGAEALDAAAATADTPVLPTEADFDCVTSGSECNAIGAVCCDSQETCFGAGGVACPHNPGESCLCQAAPSCSPECGAHGKCTAHNKCECEHDWTGDRCEVHMDKDCLSTCRQCLKDGGEYCIYTDTPPKSNDAHCVGFTPVGSGCSPSGRGPDPVHDVYYSADDCTDACTILDPESAATMAATSAVFFS